MFLALWILCAAVWLATNNRFYLHYALFLLPAVLLILGLTLDRLTNFHQPRLASQIMRLGFVLSLVFGALMLVFASEVRIPGSDPTGFAVTEQNISSYIDAHVAADGTIYVWGYFPDIYLKADRTPAGRFLYLHPLMTPGYSEAAVAEQLAYWESHPPAAIVDVSSDLLNQATLAPLLVPHEVKDTYDTRVLTIQLEPLRAFVRANYHLATTISGHQIYLLNGSGPVRP